MFKIICVITLLFNMAVARQCNPCYCFDHYKHIVADCSRRTNRPQLTSIPHLRVDVHVFNFDEQQLSKLTDYIFVQRHLTHLNAISIFSCNLETIEKHAFAHLYELQQLSLSNNKLTKLDISTFSTNRKLEALHLYNNQIEIIQNGLFDALTSLKNLDLRNNTIRSIERYVFKNNHALEHLDLSDNKLKTVDSLAISQMTRLRDLFLTANPWVCDCKLRSLFEVTSRLGTYVGYPQCAEPETQIGNLWSNMSPNDFKCWLNISLATRDIRVVDNNTIVTLGCKVNSFPSPAVHWKYRNANKHSISFSMETPDTYWSNLTILDWTVEDYGQYGCVARNYELTEEIFIDLFAENLPFIYNQTTTSVPMNNNEENITSTTEILKHKDEKYLNNYIKNENESSTIENHEKRTVPLEEETVTVIIVTAESEVKIPKQRDNIEDLTRVHLITDKVLELENKTTSVNITEFIVIDQNEKKYTDGVEDFSRTISFNVGTQTQLPLHLIIEILFCLVILFLLGIIITKKIMHKPEERPVRFPRILIHSTSANRRHSSRMSHSVNLEQGQNLLHTNGVPVYSELYAIQEATS